MYGISIIVKNMDRMLESSLRIFG